MPNWCDNQIEILAKEETIQWIANHLNENLGRRFDDPYTFLDFAFVYGDEVWYRLFIDVRTAGTGINKFLDMLLKQFKNIHIKGHFWVELCGGGDYEEGTDEHGNRYQFYTPIYPYDWYANIDDVWDDPCSEELEWDEKRIQQEHWYEEEEPPRDEEINNNVYEMLELEDTTDIDFWTDPEPMVSIYNGMFDNHDWVDYNTWVASIIAREEEFEYYELEQEFEDCCIYLESDEDIIAYQNQLSPQTFFIPTPPPPIPSMSDFPKEEIDALVEAYSCKNDKRIHEFLLKYKRLPFDICGRIHYSFRPSIGTYVLPYCIHNGMLHTALHCIDVLFETPQNLEEFKSYMDSLSFALIQDRNLEYWYAEDTLGCFSSIDYEEYEYWDWDITYYHDGVEHREMKKKILLALNRKLKEQFCGTAKALSQVSLFSGLPYLSPDLQRNILHFVDTPSFVSKTVLEHPAFKYDDPFEDPKHAVDFPEYCIEFDPESVYMDFLELDDYEGFDLKYYADPECYGSRRLDEWWTYDEYIQGILDYEAVLEMERFYEDTIPSDKELKWDQKRIQEAHWYEEQEEIPDEEELMLDDVRSNPLYSKAIDLGWIPTNYGHWEEIEWDVHYYDEDQEEYDTHLIYLQG